jgi:TFIIH basal transcription factor complex TTD-A subunit
LQTLVVCDPVMKQFLLHLDEKLLLGTKFVIQDLDENRLFISSESLEQLQEKIDDLMDKISVPVAVSGNQ